MNEITVAVQRERMKHQILRKRILEREDLLDRIEVLASRLDGPRNTPTAMKDHLTAVERTAGVQPTLPVAAPTPTPVARVDQKSYQDCIYDKMVEHGGECTTPQLKRLLPNIPASQIDYGLRSMEKTERVVRHGIGRATKWEVLIG